jgi:glycosyltransferase involved in cell wall biosynthesis
MKILVAQLGARMHYAVPRMLHEAGMLEQLFTDACAVKGWPSLLRHVPENLRPAALKRLLGRIPKGLPLDKITSFSAFGFQYARRRISVRTRTDATGSHLWAGQKFCSRILNHGLSRATGVYTFNIEGLELLKAARAKGLQAIMEQTIAPYKIECQLMAREQGAFPGWELPLGSDGRVHELVAREEEEWRHASVIVCGSEFVKEGIAACGGPAHKCAVVPYGVDASFSIPSRELRRTGPLRVLTVGAVGLRKGSPYVLEAAKALGSDAEFRMLGTVKVLPQALELLRKNVDIRGAVPRSEIKNHYAWADVFLLPSICEGSATATYEALAAGLPVIATPNTGSVVRDGLEGFIVPEANSSKIVEKLECLAAHPDLRQEFSANAVQLAKANSLEAYSARLITSIEQFSRGEPAL